MARCFVTRALPGTALTRLADAHDVDEWPEPGPPPRTELLSRANGQDGLLTPLTDCVDRELFDACPSVRAVSNYAVGTDNVDLTLATELGIPVGHTPDALTETTADLAFALMLAAARRVVEADAAVRRGEWPVWQPGGFLGHDLNGAVLGIVGLGRIGRALAARPAGFAMGVIHTGRPDGVPLDDLLARADFVSLHVPLTNETRGLIGEPELQLMKEGAYLINTSRGEIVRTDDLTRALERRSIAGAGLDVTDPEPLPRDHPLFELTNVVITPHI